MRDERGSILFESGSVSDRGQIEGNDADAGADAFEPHHQEISRGDQVAVYESVMGTPTGGPTTGLLQATQYLKDNRLLPRGFEKDSAPDDIRVVGMAVDDGDFVGGGDRVRYRIPVPGAGPVQVEVELRYQPIAYRWAQNLAPYDADEPRAFVRYYNALSPWSSVLVDRVSRTVTR